jgi:hypothetical protein
MPPPLVADGFDPNADEPATGRWWHWRRRDPQRLPVRPPSLPQPPSPCPIPRALPASLLRLRQNRGTPIAPGPASIGSASSYDHITLAGTSLPLPQEWGPLFIAASVATVAVDAQLATRARDRAANQGARDRDRAAESRERQVESLKRLHSAAVLSARVQLALISGEIPPDAGENGA